MKYEDERDFETLTKEEQKERKKKNGLDPNPDANRDPITGEPGAHPIGVATGGTAGAVTGGAIGAAVGGPVGAAVGAAAGAIVGGLVGKGAAEVVDPTVEEGYWRENYQKRPYFRSGRQFEDYSPAYRYGWESASRPDYRGRRFEDVEKQLETNWSKNRGKLQGEFSEYREPTRDAYNRVYDRTKHLSGEAAEKTDSVWEQVKGNWKQFKGTIKEKWNLLTDDEIEAMEGRRERIIGKIQEKYGEAKWSATDIENELYSFSKDRR